MPSGPSGLGEAEANPTSTKRCKPTCWQLGRLPMNPEWAHQVPGPAAREGWKWGRPVPVAQGSDGLAGPFLLGQHGDSTQNSMGTVHAPSREQKLCAGTEPQTGRRF